MKRSTHLSSNETRLKKYRIPVDVNYRAYDIDGYEANSDSQVNHGA